MAEVADLYTILRAETAPFTRGLRTAAEEGESFTARMGGLRQTMTKVGAATSLVAVGFAVYGVKAAGDFQQKMNLLVTACGESTKNLKKVSDGVLSLARQTGTSTNELSDGMYQVEKAGYRGADGLTVLKAAAQGAREEGANLKDVTNAMTSVMASYHLKATDSVRVMNALKTAAGEGKMTMEEFSRSLSTVIPIASANKISFGEVGGAIATLTQHGTSAQEATQELSNTIRNLAGPNNVAIAEMQKLSLSSVDVSTHLGKRGLTGTLDLLSQTVLSKMGKSGTVLLSTFNQTKQAARDADTMVKAMPASMQKLATSYAKGTVSLGDWRKELKTLPPEQANLLTQYATLQNKTNGFQDALKRGGPAAQTYTDAIKKMTGGATGLNATLQLTGENTNGFKDRVDKVSASFNHASKDVEGWNVTQKSFNVQMARLKEAVVTTAITIGLKLIPVILATIGFFEKHRSACIALAIVIGTILVTAVVAFTISLWNMAAAAWATGIPEIILAVTALVVALVLLVRHWGDVWSSVKAATKATLDWIVDKWHWLRDKTAEGWHSITAALTTAWRAVAAFFNTAWHAVADPIVTAWNWVSNATTTVWNAISGFFRKWWPLLLVIFMPFVALVISIWNHFHQQITAVVTAVWTTVSSFLKTVWSGIKLAAGVAWAAVQIAIINPIMTVWHTIQSIWKTISGWLSTAWGGIRATAASLWGSIKSAMTGPINSAWETITSTVGKIATAISSGLNQAWTAVSNIGDQFLSIGSAIVTGIVNGITNVGGLIGDKIKSLASSALSDAKSFLGIGSPSRVFANEVGRWIPEGLALGVSNNAHVAHRAVTDMATGTVNAFSTELEINSPSKKFAALGAYVVAGLVSGLTGSTARVRAATEHIARSLYTDFGTGHKALQKAVAQDNAQLMKLARNRDSVAARLKAAQSKLAALQKSWTTEKNSVASAIMQSASIVTASPDEGRSVNAFDVVDAMRDKVQKATQFAAELDQLRKKGLRSDLIQQLAAAGVDQAGDTALALAAASKGQIAQMNQMQGNLQTAANATGSAVADSMYGAGIKSAQGLVKGLQSQEAAIQKQMMRIALGMQKAIKKALGIRSPSRVFATLGEFIPQGLAQGISKGTHHATTAVHAMAGAVVGAGAMAGLAGGGGTVVNQYLSVNVAGSVMSDQKLIDVVEKGFLKLGARNPMTYQPYKR